MPTALCRDGSGIGTCHYQHLQPHLGLEEYRVSRDLGLATSDYVNRSTFSGTVLGAGQEVSITCQFESALRSHPLKVCERHGHPSVPLV